MAGVASADVALRTKWRRCMEPPWDGGLARKRPLTILDADEMGPAPADVEGGIKNVEIDPDAREWWTGENAAGRRRGRRARPRPGEDPAHRDRAELHRHLHAKWPLSDADAQRRGP